MLGGAPNAEVNEVELRRQCDNRVRGIAMTQTLASGSTIVAPAEAYRLTTPPGTRVELSDIALKSLDAAIAGLTRSAVGSMRGRAVTMVQSAIGAAITRRVEARW
ncbi:MAG: hypothetical protein EBT22_00920 [Chloroflexi bacterium]|nr:hypothetical protein [Chloroflexota bacterium]